MPSGFSTKEFKFNEGLLSIFRTTKIEQIPFDQITMIELKKGSDLKRPKLALVFGIAVLLVCIKVLSAFNFNSEEFFIAGTVIRILAVLFFLGGIGVSSVYFALPIHPVIEIQIKTVIERHSISSIVEAGAVGEFSIFLQKEFPSKFRNSLAP